jgi:hypothetical protein
MMSQHDYVIGNDTAANVRADINTALLAIASNNSGASAPATMYANQWWYDSTNDILKIRSEANDAWISVAKLNQTSKQFFPIVGGVEVTATGTEMNYLSGVTSAIQTQLNAKAPLASPALTGTPTAPTATVGTNTTQIATTAFVLANVPAAGSMTLLGTLTTTSGATQTLSGLTLTSYTSILAVINGVSGTNTSFVLRLNSATGENLSESAASIAVALYGCMWLDLPTGIIATTTDSFTGGTGVGIGVAMGGLQSTITTASTSITFGINVGTFDAGSIRIYGVK